MGLEASVAGCWKSLADLLLSKPLINKKHCVGWGHTSHGGSASPQLKSVMVKMVGKEECRKAYSANAITDRMICAGTREGGKDACQVDQLILTMIVFTSQGRVTVAEAWL